MINYELLLVERLPTIITIGRQTEYGVSEIRIDCSRWLVQWPDMTLGIWVTPPGGAGAYPAATRMDGDVLVWTVGAGDTAVVGNGTMEIMGIAEGRKKLSCVVNTRILDTTTDTTADPPETSQAWVDIVLAARDDAERAAERAEEIAEEIGSSGIAFTTDDTLTLEDGVLSVNTANDVEQDNTLPITSAAVFAEVGNINSLLATI